MDLNALLNVTCAMRAMTVTMAVMKILLNALEKAFLKVNQEQRYFKIAFRLQKQVLVAIIS